MENPVVVHYIRWAEPLEIGLRYEQLDRNTNTWHPVSAEDIRGFRAAGEVVHMNPEFINRAE